MIPRFQLNRVVPVVSIAGTVTFGGLSPAVSPVGTSPGTVTQSGFAFITTAGVQGENLDITYCTEIDVPPR